MPSEMRSFSTSTSSTLALTRLALLVVRHRLLAGSSQDEVGHVDHAVDVRADADEQAELGDVADLALDHGAGRMRFEEDCSHGLRLDLLQAERDAALRLSTSRMITSTSCEVATILPGWTFFLVQDISETCTRPSTPGSSSTKAP